ncbi:MAG: hypothetical protein JXB10_07325 [Pirellulales bacterium]|nr:hypothetical protein [Pirellulales bacterium]
MKRRRGFLFCGLFFTAAAIGFCTVSRAEDCKLELVRLDQSPRGNAIYRNASAQYSIKYLGKNARRTGGEDDFEKLVKKEPEKYVAEDPFRGVVKLGSRQFVFVLDKQDKESKDYDRLYFDINGNGDLTDEKPIDAEAPKPPEITEKDGRLIVVQDGVTRTYRLPSKKISPREKDEEKEESSEEKKKQEKAKEAMKQRIVANINAYRPLRFPRVDIPIEIDGKKLDYSFFFNSYTRRLGVRQYVTVMLTPAVYCRGEIELDGKKTPVVVLDHNSNGRFDDVMTVMQIGPGERLYPQYGDVLLIDPEHMTPVEMRRGSSAHRQYLARLNQYEGKFIEMKVSPTGDALSWSPAEAAFGKIVSDHSFSALELIGDLGYLSLNLPKSQPVEIPAGDWHMLSYVLQGEQEMPPEAKNETEKKDENQLLREALRKTKRSSTLQARGSGKNAIIHIEAGQTATLKYGPPYRLSVTPSYQPGTVRFSLVMQGAQGEQVTSLTVDGKRPPKPELTITDPKGEVVQKGNFEYG